MEDTETYVVTIIQNGTYERTLVFTVWDDRNLIDDIYDEMAKPHWDQCPFSIRDVRKAHRAINLANGEGR